MNEIEGPVDAAYQRIGGQVHVLEHAYGEGFHILADSYLLTRLARVCAEETVQPEINDVICDLYRALIHSVLIGEFPKIVQTTRTRMASSSPLGFWSGEVIDPSTRAVTVDIARAGMMPSQVCFDTLNRILTPDNVRQDHVIMARRTDERGQVIGAHFGESKIGGDVDKAVVLFPDPMGATGGSISEAIRYYKHRVAGKAIKLIALHLIVTPEYLKRLKTDHPDVVVYAIRLDRGASPDDVLLARPGERWDEESGLTDQQYIVPGGGGFGEIINNSYC